MDKQRYHFLIRASDEEATLTKQEMAEGWHWCVEWDFMLVGPGMELEQSCCLCFKEVIKPRCAQCGYPKTAHSELCQTNDAEQQRTSKESHE